MILRADSLDEDRRRHADVLRRARNGELRAAIAESRRLERRSLWLRLVRRDTDARRVATA